MAAGEIIRDIFCNPNFNLTLTSFGGAGFDLTEADLFGEAGNVTGLGSVQCMNGTKWDRDALLGNGMFRKIMDNLNIYLTPVIILLGMVGNVMAFLVFTTTHLKRQSSSVYLASLAIVDMVFLICLSIIWLSWIRVNIFHRHIWCQCVVYLTYVCSFLSVWYVVSFTIERYIIVHYPLRKDRYCTRTRAKKVVGSLAVLALVLYSFSVFTNGSVSFGNDVKVCTPLTRHYTIFTIVTYFDFVCTLVVPSAVIILMNVRIVIRIMGYPKQRVEVEIFESRKSSSSEGKRQQQQQQQPGVVEEMSDGNTMCTIRIPRNTTYLMRSQSVNARASNTLTGEAKRSVNMQPIRIAHGRRQAQYRTARMLIIVSTMFVILNSPNHIFRIHAFLRSSIDDRYMTDLNALKWHELFQLLYHLHFSINFFLYSAWGRQFRIALCILCTRIAHKFRPVKEFLENLRPCKHTTTTTVTRHDEVPIRLNKRIGKHETVV